MGLVGLALPALVAGCSGNDNSGGDNALPDLSTLTGISITPGNQTLEVDGTAAKTVTYSVSGTFNDGHSQDITRAVAFVQEPAFGIFEGPSLTVPADRGGVSTITAVAGAGATVFKATAGLEVSVRRGFSDPKSAGLPADVAQKFAGAEDAAKKPELVYPNDGVLLPPNLGRLEFHFVPQGGTSLYQLTLSNQVTSVQIYLSCYRPNGVASGCIYETDPAVWKAIAETNRGGSPLQVLLKATDASGATVGTSTPLGLSFSRDNIEGGLYYWTTSGNTGIMRFDFASTTQTVPELFADATATGNSGVVCIGCHALTRDGKKIVAEAGGQSDGRLLMLDVATFGQIAPFGAPAKSIFESWSPDSSQFAGVYADSGATDCQLRIHDGASGLVAQSLSGTGDCAQSPANHPDWAPSGDRVAYVKMGDRSGNPSTNQKFFQGSLQMVTRTAGAWSAPTELLPLAPGKNRYYPAFAPDSNFLVFNESTCASGNQHISCNADSDPTAKIFALRPVPGATPIPLTQANAPGKRDGSNTSLTNSFPKWSPFMFRRTADGTRLNWLTFASTRNYGLRTPVPGASAESTRGTLLWMVAVDPDKVGLGADPSFPAFALPFQDLGTSNHIGQWAEKVVPRIK